MNDKRPRWEHEISEKLFKKINESKINFISKDFTYTDNSSEHFLVLHCADKKKIKTKVDISQYFEVSLAPSDPVLKLNTFGERAAEDLKKIHKWEINNAEELAEYERLKKKFKNGGDR